MTYLVQLMKSSASELALLNLGRGSKACGVAAASHTANQC